MWAFLINFTAPPLSADFQLIKREFLHNIPAGEKINSHVVFS